MPIIASASPLYAGQVRPPDVPAYVPQQIAYATGTNPPVIGDGTTTGGFAPYWASQLADIPTASRTSWLVDPAINLADFLTTADGGSLSEGKMRTHAEFGAPCYADNIRYYKDRTARSHLHFRFGNLTQNSSTTFATLRTPAAEDDKSGAAGGLLNSTGYLMPALLFDKDGKTYAITPGYSVIYYAQDPALHDNIHPIPLGKRYVAGFDMDIPNRAQDIVDVANADNGGGSRYRVHQSTSKDSQIFHTWIAENTGGDVTADSILGTGGSDPFAGALIAANGATGLRLQMSQPLAWDGVNPWSPRGYDHVIPAIWDTVSSRYVPPTGWYALATPQFSMGWDIVALEAFLGGPMQNFNPRLSSDMHHSALPGRTVHWDWTGGWDSETLRNWEINAIGCGVLSGIPHELNDSVIDADEKLIVNEAAPDGKSPQVDFTRGNQIFEIPPKGSAISTRLIT